MESLIKKGHCAYCKTEIRDVLCQGPHPKTKAKYCPNCGAQLWAMHTCGGHMRYEDRFCPKCGDPNPIYLGNDPDYFADSVNEE
jgi:ribosomal protein S27AE